MFKVIKRTVLGSLSILGVSFISWVLFFLNPEWSYANQTQFDFVTVYHNQNLLESTETVINDAIQLIKKSKLFNDEISLELCLNDDNVYPHLHPLVGCTLAYATFNKTTIKNGTVIFDENTIETQWAVNNYEYRKFNLTWLLAHEFTHNLQYHANFNYVIKSTLGKVNWKLEGHAEYIARGFQNDGQLKNKIAKYLIEEQKEHKGLPVFELEDGTKQIFSYYKYALITQYLIEQKKLNFIQICELETGLDEVYHEMIEWGEKLH